MGSFLPARRVRLSSTRPSACPSICWRPPAWPGCPLGDDRLAEKRLAPDARIKNRSGETQLKLLRGYVWNRTSIDSNFTLMYLFEYKNALA